MLLQESFGVATHYLADYFCRVHNNINGKKHPEGIAHIFYEQKMLLKVSRETIERLSKEAEDKVSENLKFINKNSLSTFLIKKHRKYLKNASKLYFHDNEKKRNILDISNTLEIILTVCSYIISSIIVV